MPPRTRGAAALEMHPDSDVDMEGEPDFSSDAEESEGVDDPGIMSEEDEDEIQSDEGPGNGEGENEEDEELSTAPRLKIKLKLPAQPTLSSGNVTPVKVFSSPSKASRRYRPIVPESEEESEEGASSDVSEEVQPGTSRSTTGTPSYGTRPMTTRQAVLASVVGSSHVSLDEGSRSKKQPLNETELALRREETARKRKNLTEKRLEDEKAETINRLLKRQSRPKNRRTNVDVVEKENIEEGEGEEAVEGIQPVHEEVKPVMYRWVSTSRPPAHQARSRTEQGMLITFSVPNIVQIPSTERGDTPIPSAPATCAVEGCGAVRKYRLVRNSAIGACGMNHLKLLEERHKVSCTTRYK